jgi:Aspartyl protease
MRCLLPVVLLCLVEGALGDELSLRVVEGRPVVDGVFVNGAGPYRFLVDTGATMNHLEAGLARKAGLRPTFRTELTSSLGMVAVPGNDGLSVAVGETRADEQSFLFAGMDAVHGLSTDIQGILGQAFLSRFDYTIDLRGRRLAFGKREAAGKRAVFQRLGGRALVATSLGDLILDSGTGQLVLFGEAGTSGGQSYMRTLTGSGLVGLIQSRLAIGGRSVWTGQAVALPKREEPGVAGLLPIRLFRSVYVCNSEGYLVFQ